MTLQQLNLSNFAFGWYPLVWKTNLKAGNILNIQAFEKNILLFRTSSGIPVATSPLCFMCGSFLKKTGKIIADHLCCSLCSARIDQSGFYEQYDTKQQQKLSWILVEKGPWILVWYDPKGRSPLFDYQEPMEYRDRKWISAGKWNWFVNTNQCEFIENAVDTVHFCNIHGHEVPPTCDFLKFHEFTFSFTQNFKKKILGRIINGHADVLVYANSLATIHTKPFSSILVLSYTPLSTNRLRWMGELLLPKSRIPFISNLLAPIIMKQLKKDLAADIPILENKIVSKDPIWCANDKPIIQVRRWCEKLYV